MDGTQPAPHIPGFRDLAPLGRGGFSVVYRAYQERFDRWVAVKVLTFALTDDRSQRRFLRECQVAGRLSAHPNIVTVYDAGLSPDGRPYISMELFDQGSIGDRLARTGPFAVPDALRVAISLAGALESAHRAGVVHRDVKPGNALLAAYGQPALTDFGLSVVAERHELSVGVDALTPYHAAPEVLERTAVSASSDVYSLASTTYAMLAGRAPHELPGGPDSMAALLLRILQVDVPPIGRPDVPRSLEAALRGGLARDPGTRAPSALAFAQGLQQAQRELGVEVTDPVTLDVGAPAPAGPDAPAAPAAARPLAYVPGEPSPAHTVPDPPGVGPPRGFGGPTSGHTVPVPPGQPGTGFNGQPGSVPPGQPGPGFQPGSVPPGQPGSGFQPGSVPPGQPGSGFQPGSVPPGQPGSGFQPGTGFNGPGQPATGFNGPGPPSPGLGASSPATPGFGPPGPDSGPPPGTPAGPPAYPTAGPPGDSTVHRSQFAGGAPAAGPSGVPTVWTGSGVAGGDTTVLRSQARGERPAPLAAATKPKKSKKSRGKVVLASIAGVLAVGAAVGGGIVLVSGGDDEQPPPEDETTSTTVTDIDALVPTNVAATESEAGIQLTWEGDEDASYTILVLSEADPPTAIPASGPSSHLVPITALRPDSGYCFSVANDDALNAAPAGEESQAFSTPTCVRGASQGTVRVE